MFLKWFYFVTLIVIYLFPKGTICFFVKQFSGYGDTSGRCIKDTGLIQSSGSWGNLSFLGFNGNSCLDPAAQFRFRYNGAMLNLKRQGCLAAFNKNGSGYNLDMLYLFVDSVSLDTASCAQKPDEGIYRAITHTPEGALSVYYKGKDKFQTWCAWYRHSYQFYNKYGIIYYMGLRTPCHSIYSSQKFIFGSVTCHGDKVKNANCPKDQYMVVKFATYRGLLAPKKCGLSDDYSCEVDVTCLVKKQCDGLHECNVTVDENLFSRDQCPGLSNYLYFEYQCVDTVKPFEQLCVHDVSLSYSSLPYKGVVQFAIDGSTKNVCWQSLNDRAKDIVCRHLGYDGVYSLVNISTPTNAKDAVVSGSISCSGDERYLSQCSINVSAGASCSELSYIECIPVGRFYWHIIWSNNRRPLLVDKEKIPDSSFSATGFSKGHSASDARISSGSSWCGLVSNYKHYLQVDLGRLYFLYHLVIYGDSTSPKWVATYSINYTTDLVNWKNKILQGNKNAYDHASWESIYIITRALRFIPLTYVGEPCMRIETWGTTLLPDKPTNLTVAYITSRSAEISWAGPENEGRFGFSRFWIELKKENYLILNITTRNMSKYKINNLTPYTTYKISVAAGNNYGFGEETVTTFLTFEESPSGPPLNIKTLSRSLSSLFLTWDCPEKTKQNGVIISYTACVSHSRKGRCFQTFITIANKRKWLVGNLNTSTKYYVRVLASTKVGNGNYSESKGFFTNERPVGRAIAQTPKTLTFLLKIPSKKFVYFYVVALKLTDGKEPASSDNYEDDKLVTYATAKKSAKPKPYVAAVVTSSGVDGNTFVLGDGRNIDNLTSQTANNYFNGPLEPGTSYSIFQRIIINEKGDYYSTDWSPSSKTSEYRVLETHENNDFSKYFIGIIALAILLDISFVIIAYLVYQTRRLQSSNTEENAEKMDEETCSRHSYDIPENNCENVNDEQSTYTALKRPGEDDDHLYGHLNPVPNAYVDQEETMV